MNRILLVVIWDEYQCESQSVLSSQCLCDSGGVVLA